MSTIKVIAPLSPAGEFPVADANDISMISRESPPKSGSLAETLTEFQQEFEAITGVEDTISAKLDIANETLETINTKLGIYNTNENIKTTITTGNQELQDMLFDLKSHINTMLPPTLEVSRTGDLIYAKDVTPTLEILAEVNRPLDNPLVLYIGEELAQSESRQYSKEWTPSYPTGRSLPYTVSLEVSIRDKADTSLVYTKKTVSCTFAEKVYWGMAEVDYITTKPEDFKSKLSAGHPSSLTFTGTGKYCYYMYPSTYGTPTISVDGFAGGFTECEETVNLNDIVYNIYKSNQKLDDTTITIK